MAKLTKQQEAELQALAEMSDDDIDFSDIPDLPDAAIDPAKVKRGLLYQPVNQEVTVLLDRFVIDWLEQNLPDEPARSEIINSILMEYVKEQKFPGRKKSKGSIPG